MNKKFYQELNELAEQTAGAKKVAALKMEKLNLTEEQLKQKLIDLGAYWGIIKLVLKFVKIFTGAKADAKIDEIIDWGNSIFA